MQRPDPAPGDRARTTADGIVALAERQGGVLHRRQLLALGLSGSAISRWEAGGRIHRLYPAVYALGHRSLVEEGQLRAALLYAGEGFVLSHLTAASWTAILDAPLAPIHLSGLSKIRTQPGLVIHGRRSIDETVHRGLPATNAPMTLLDIATMIPFARLRRALAEVEFQRLATLDEVAGVLRKGRPGSRALRRALLLHRPQLARTRSELEQRFLALCEWYSIPLPAVNVMVCGFMVDALWRRERVVVELDGRAAHGTDAGFERDRHRDLVLRRAGFEPLRYSWNQVARRHRLVAADVLRALNRQPSQSGPAHRA